MLCVWKRCLAITAFKNSIVERQMVTIPWHFQILDGPSNVG